MSDETRGRIATAWPDILADIAGGMLIRDALKARDLSRDMLRLWLSEDSARRVQWDEAREASADAFAEEALIIAREHVTIETLDAQGQPLPAPLIVRIDPAHARTYIDTLKWAARTRNPRTYSDKSTVDLNVRTVDLNRIIADANARLEASRAVGRVIEGAIVARVLGPSHDPDQARTLADLL